MDENGNPLYHCVPADPWHYISACVCVWSGRMCVGQLHRGGNELYLFIIYYLLLLLLLLLLLYAHFLMRSLASRETMS